MLASSLDKQRIHAGDEPGNHSAKRHRGEGREQKVQRSGMTERQPKTLTYIAARSNSADMYICGAACSISTQYSLVSDVSYVHVCVANHKFYVQCRLSHTQVRAHTSTRCVWHKARCRDTMKGRCTVY